MYDAQIRSIFRHRHHNHHHYHYNRHHFRMAPISSWFIVLLISIISLGAVIDCRRQQQQQQPSSTTITKRSSSSKFVDENDSIDYFNINNNNNNGDEIDEEFDDFNCPEKFGYYPDEKNCSRYHLCDHGKSRLKSCDDGLVFSTILKTCDWPYNVHCNHGNGDRGDFVGKHLRLRNNGDADDKINNDDNNIDKSSKNRRQPVLSNEADDSYWLGRPNSDLLAYLDDNDNNYHDIHHENFQDFDIPRRIVTNTNRVQNGEIENKQIDDGGQPWFQNVNFEQRRPMTTSSQSTTSANQRGNQGWRSTKPVINTSTTRTPTLLPRKAVSSRDNIENEEDFLLTDNGAHRRIPENDLGDYRRKPPKNDRDSYRIVSFQQPNPITTNDPQTTTTTTRSQPIWFQQTTPPPTTTRQTATQIGSRPRHLGTSVRRKVIRKKIIPQITTTTSTTSTSAPTFKNVADFWNNNDPWKSSRYESNQPTLNPTTVNPKPIGSIRRTIPKFENRQRFERKPVLRDESEDANERINDDDEDDDVVAGRNFVYNTPEIVRNRNNSSHRLDNDLLIPKNKVKDVSNNINNNVRFRPTTARPSINQPVTPSTVTTTTSNRNNNQNLNNAFDAGFRHAILPINRPISSSLQHQPPPPNIATDIEYEDLENDDDDDDDEDVDDISANDDDNNNNSRSNSENNNNQSLNNNKEIVVRYDDDADDNHHQNHHLDTRRPQFSTNQQQFSNNTNNNRFQTTTRNIALQSPKLTRLSNNNENINTFNPNRRSILNDSVGPLQSNPKNKVSNNNRSTAIHNAFTATNPESPLYRSQQFLSDPNQLSNNWQLFDNTNPINKFITNKKHPKQPIIIYPNNNNNNNNKQQTNNNHKVLKNEKRKNPSSSSLISNKKLLNGNYTRAKRCIPERCQPPDCRCGGLDIPGGFKPREIPQLVVLTFDDSVNDLNLHIYRRLFEQGRTNPNGCPISATFYVSHEWTDYSQVQNLYAKGHEIASHSVSHSFGEKFSKERWLDEILGQKEILHLYGGVDPNEIRGMRAPFLQTGGDTMFEMLHQANFSYDSSLPVYDIDPPYWPYTLDYSINHDCMIEPCPSNSYPGFWEVGMVMWEDLRGGRCSMADGCFNPSDEDGVYEMVKRNFLRHYTSNRAPFGMYFHSRWFLTEHNMNGFIRFLDEMLQLDDIYLVTNWQMIQWMRNPTPLTHMKKFKPFGCDHIRNRPPLCKAPHTCKARFRSEIRTLKTCQKCPQSYPWTGNNGSG
ncbi:uncharacterized protein LOC113790217 isoform X3 [Dermatophagoides pteronyssinus]|uniref:uncharacterized protein LOC113790217 isoform X3 n=1 Tax=Dermatophagoides pteronyssinus TaxID=6956 RepID=UPI003F662655